MIRVAFMVAMFGVMVVNATSESVTERSVVSSNHLSNLVDFVHTGLPVSRAEVGVDGKYVGEDGVTPKEPVFFEVARQDGTFYLRQLSQVDTRGVHSVTNGPIYGGNQTHRWIVKGNTIYASLVGETANAELDPVAAEVRAFQLLAFSPLRLGFPTTWEPVRVLDENRVLLQGKESEMGKEVVATVETGEGGRPCRLQWSITNEYLEATITLDYTYSNGERPFWLPAVIRSSVDERHLKDGKRLAYSDTEHVRRCVVGPARLPDGYTPGMFISDADTQATISWTNGRGVRVQGTNVTEILPADTPSAARETGGGQFSRWMVMSVLCFTSLVTAWLLWRMRFNNKH